MILGSTPPWPQLTSLAMGFRPYFSTASLEASTMAAAPSLMPEAWPAVTRWTCFLASASGDAEIIVAGGMENMSAAPYALPAARWGARMGDNKMKDTMISDGLWDV